MQFCPRPRKQPARGLQEIAAEGAAMGARQTLRDFIFQIHVFSESCRDAAACHDWGGVGNVVRLQQVPRFCLVPSLPRPGTAPESPLPTSLRSPLGHLLT